MKLPLKGGVEHVLVRKLLSQSANKASNANKCFGRVRHGRP